MLCKEKQNLNLYSYEEVNSDGSLNRGRKIDRKNKIADVLSKNTLTFSNQAFSNHLSENAF